jgi:hypothetical protein
MQDFCCISSIAIPNGLIQAKVRDEIVKSYVTASNYYGHQKK